jgi:hypothetical protein
MNANRSNILARCIFTRRIFTRRGFTFVELCIGLVVTSLVLSALAAFSLATAEAWKQGSTMNAVGGGETVAAIPLIANVVSARVDNEIATAIGVGGYFPGNLTDPTGQQASILLWKTNDNFNTIAPKEVELLEFDSTNHMIWKYTSTQTTPTITYAAFTSSWIATFKSMATKTPFAKNVDGMQIYVNAPNSASQLPLVEYRLYFSRGGNAQTRYGAVCVHSPVNANGQTPT